VRCNAAARTHTSSTRNGCSVPACRQDN
jgi:hypothetical protein